MRSGYIDHEAQRARLDVERDYYAERALSARASALVLACCVLGIVAVVAGVKVAKVLGWLS